MLNNTSKGIAALIVMTCIGASMGLFARWLEEAMGLYQQVFFRILAGFILGIPLFYKKTNLSKVHHIPLGEWLLIFLRGSAIYLFGITFGTRAFIAAKYSNVAFIMALPVTALLGLIIFRGSFNFRKIILLITSFIGVLIIAVKDYTQIFIWDVGAYWALLATSLVSFGILARKWHSELLNNQEITQLVLFFAVIQLFIASLATGESIGAIKWSFATIVVVFTAGLFNVLYMLLANYGFQKVDALLANNIVGMQPIFAIVIGYIGFQDIPTMHLA
ncbi:MAG: DMT family transporter [Rhizonema sp. PD37]|nr:DMT family transporter [Rhizonema sp. PD37]